jgi:hypothetical protein
VVLPQRRVEIDWERFQIGERFDPAAVLEQGAGAQEVLIVLEHQSLGGVPVHSVVRGARLEKLVEPAQEAVLASGLHVGEPEPDRFKAVLGVSEAEVETNGDSLDQIPELSKDVLGQQLAVVGQRIDVPTDRVVSVPDVLADRGH